MCDIFFVPFVPLCENFFSQRHKGHKGINEFLIPTLLHNDFLQKRDFLFCKVPLFRQVGHERYKILSTEHLEEFIIATGNLLSGYRCLISCGIFGSPADDAFVHKPIKPRMHRRLCEESSAFAEPLDGLVEVY